MAGSAGAAVGIAVEAASGDDAAEGVGAIEATEVIHPAIRTTRLSSATIEWRLMPRIVVFLIGQSGGGRNLRRRDPADVTAGDRSAAVTL